MAATAAVAALFFAGCAVRIPLGAEACYGRVVVGYEPPASLAALADAPAFDGKTLAPLAR